MITMTVPPSSAASYRTANSHSRIVPPSTSPSRLRPYTGIAPGSEDGDAEEDGDIDWEGCLDSETGNGPQKQVKRPISPPLRLETRILPPGYQERMINSAASSPSQSISSYVPHMKREADEKEDEIYDVLPSFRPLQEQLRISSTPRRQKDFQDPGSRLTRSPNNRSRSEATTNGLTTPPNSSPERQIDHKGAAAPPTKFYPPTDHILNPPKIPTRSRFERGTTSFADEDVPPLIDQRKACKEILEEATAKAISKKLKRPTPGLRSVVSPQRALHEQYPLRRSSSRNSTSTVRPSNHETQVSENIKADNIEVLIIEGGKQWNQARRRRSSRAAVSKFSQKSNSMPLTSHATADSWYETIQERGDADFQPSDNDGDDDSGNEKAVSVTCAEAPQCTRESVANENRVDSSSSVSADLHSASEHGNDHVPQSPDGECLCERIMHPYWATISPTSDNVVCYDEFKAFDRSLPNASSSAHFTFKAELKHYLSCQYHKALRWDLFKAARQFDLNPGFTFQSSANTDEARRRQNELIGNEPREDDFFVTDDEEEAGEDSEVSGSEFDPVMEEREDLAEEMEYILENEREARDAVQRSRDELRRAENAKARHRKRRLKTARLARQRKRVRNDE